MKKNLLPIEAIAAKLDLPDDLYEKRSPVSGKLSLELLKDARFNQGGKLILVTATTPTVSGEGKTVTSIGLVQGLEAIGKRAILSSREPSLGPVFGMKGERPGAGARRWSRRPRSICTSTAISMRLRVRTTFWQP